MDKPWNQGSARSAALLCSLPKAERLLAGCAYYAYWLKDALKHEALHPEKEVARKARQARQAWLQATQQD